MTDVRIDTQPLGGSPLSRALQERRAPATWTSSPSSIEEWKRRAATRGSQRDWAGSWRCLAPALQATGAARARLQRVIDGNGVVVTTGQQPGLFGGPIYTLSKAVSAIAFADALEAATGIPTVPIFWAATDDADFAEAASTAVARQGGLEVLRSDFAPPAGTPMSLAPLGDLGSQVERLAAASGSAADPRPVELLRGAYAALPAATVGSAFVQLMRGLLEPLGMPVLDASDDGVWAASESVLTKATAASREIEARLRERASEIRRAGFEPQVEDVPGLSLVFAREGSLKRRLAVGEQIHGARLTPNVLLRPVVEHEILPTVAYLAGPGELAYFAQVSTVADALSLDPPVALPRWSCTLVEPQLEELLQRLDATEQDLVPEGELESRLARAALDPDAATALARLRETLLSLPEWMRSSAEALNLERAVQGAAGAMHHRADRLERRLLAAVKRRETSSMADVATLRAFLRPLGKPQERVLNPIPFLARNGMTLLHEMRDAAGPHAGSLLSRRGG